MQRCYNEGDKSEIWNKGVEWKVENKVIIIIQEKKPIKTDPALKKDDLMKYLKII